MTMTRIRPFVTLALAVLLGVVLDAGQSMQVTPLARDGRVLVSFRLSDAFNEDVRAAIHSGLTITFVYDHHVRDLTRKLTHIQHDFQGHIMAGMHVHLDHDHCLEVLVVKGKVSEIREVADALVSVKGVKHGKLTMTTTGKGIV